MTTTKLKLADVLNLEAEINGFTNPQTNEKIINGLLNEKLSLVAKYWLNDLSKKANEIKVLLLHDIKRERWWEYILCFKEYSSTTCVSCKNNNFRVSDNKCVQIISNCVNYLGNKCTACKQGSKLFNNMCILETECGPLCQVITIWDNKVLLWFKFTIMKILSIFLIFSFF